MSDSSVASLIEAIDRAGDGLPGLDVSADLTVHVAGHELAVEAYTDRVFVDFPSVGAMVDVVRATPGGGSSGSNSTGQALPAALAAADLTAVAQVGSREIATLGAEADGPLRHLGYRNVSVSAGNVLLAALGA